MKKEFQCKQEHYEWSKWWDTLPTPIADAIREQWVESGAAQKITLRQYCNQVIFRR